MMVYKNLHLEDFEAIRLGTSKIDEAYRAVLISSVSAPSIMRRSLSAICWLLLV